MEGSEEDRGKKKKKKKKKKCSACILATPTARAFHFSHAIRFSFECVLFHFNTYFSQHPLFQQRRSRGRKFPFEHVRAKEEEKEEGERVYRDDKPARGSEVACAGSPSSASFSSAGGGSLSGARPAYRSSKTFMCRAAFLADFFFTLLILF